MTGGAAAAVRELGVRLGAGLASALLFGASLWGGPLGLAACVFSPLPVALAGVRGGPTGGALAAAAGILVAAVLGGPAAAIAYAVYFGLGGWVLGLAAHRRAGPEQTVGAAALATLLAFAATMSFQSAAAGVGPLELLAEGLRVSAEEVKGALGAAAAGPEVARALDTWVREAPRFFVGVVSVIAVLTAWANALLLRAVLRRRGAELASWNTWRARESWIWFLIGSGLVAVLGPRWLATVGWNVLLPFAAAYFLQGLAVVSHFFEARDLPRFVRGLGYALVFVQVPAVLVVTGVGAFDLWLDFRSRWSRPNKTT